MDYCRARIRVCACERVCARVRTHYHYTSNNGYCGYIITIKYVIELYNVIDIDVVYYVIHCIISPTHPL